MKWIFIEDNEFDRDILDISFNEIKPELCADFSYTFYNNGTDFLKGLSNLECEIVISDMNLPDMNGIEILKKFKENDRLKDTPFLLFSTSLHQEEIEKAYALGADNYILKPDGFKATCETLLKIYSNYAK